MIDDDGHIDFTKVRFNAQTFQRDMPAFEEQVPDFDSVLYDPATDPVMEAHALLNKGEFPEQYYNLRDRLEQDQNRANINSRVSEWRHIKKLIAQRTDLEEKLHRKS